MDRALKQRLLGAVILTALLVILVPEWLDGAGHKSRYPSHIEVPRVPEFKPMQELMEKPAEPQPQSAIQVDAPAPEQPETAPVEQAKPVATPKTQSSINAWALQVGSFNDEANARVLRDRMRANGYAAYIHEQKSRDRTQYRVRIGPELDRSRIDRLKEEIASKEKIKGLVVKHP